jgi:hypothetical protein
VLAPYLPGTFEDFVRMVVPELRRRGLIAAVPAQGPLRSRLGLEERFVGNAASFNGVTSKTRDLSVSGEKI